jgi:hypothetical protein
MLDRLRTLLPTKLGLNTKPLAAVYKEWGKMNANQRKTTIEFWDKMPLDKKTLFLTLVREDTTRSANTILATAAATTNEPPTTKDDMCRVLALRSDPGAQLTWASAQEGNTNRRILDARRSTSAPNGLSGSLAEEADPYGTLSVQFNDYDTFLPQVSIFPFYIHDTPL